MKSLKETIAGCWAQLSVCLLKQKLLLLFFVLFCFEAWFSYYPRLSWNSLCLSGWFWAPSCTPASASWVEAGAGLEQSFQGHHFPSVCTLVRIPRTLEQEFVKPHACLLALWSGISFFSKHKMFLQGLFHSLLWLFKEGCTWFYIPFCSRALIRPTCKKTTNKTPPNASNRFALIWKHVLRALHY